MKCWIYLIMLRYDRTQGCSLREGTERNHWNSLTLQVKIIKQTKTGGQEGKLGFSSLTEHHWTHTGSPVLVRGFQDSGTAAFRAVKQPIHLARNPINITAITPQSKQPSWRHGRSQIHQGLKISIPKYLFPLAPNSDLKIIHHGHYT